MAGTGPTHAQSGQGGRMYQHPITGERAMSVTTILGNGVPKRALTGWAAKSAAQYAVDNMAELARLCDTRQGKAEALQRIKGAPWNQRDSKADIGSAVHDAAERLGLGEQVGVSDFDDEVAPYVQSLVRFWREARPEVVMAEATVWNRKYGYAGTLDLIATLRGAPALAPLTVVDYKTGKRAYPEVALQLAAYSHAEFALLDDGSEHELPGPLASAAVVVLHPARHGNGRYELVPVSVDNRYWLAFLYALEVAMFVTKYSKVALDEPLRLEAR